MAVITDKGIGTDLVKDCESVRVNDPTAEKIGESRSQTVSINLFKFVPQNLKIIGVPDRTEKMEKMITDFVVRASVGDIGALALNAIAHYEKPLKENFEAAYLSMKGSDLINDAIAQLKKQGNEAAETSPQAYVEPGLKPKGTPAPEKGPETRGPKR